MMWGKDEDDSIYVFPVQQTNGNWVKWEDYFKLQAEVERLTKAIEGSSYYFMSIKLNVENARLQAEVERLTALVESNLNCSKVMMGKSDAVLHERDSLKAENEELYKDYEVLADEHTKLIDKNARLKTEVERLTNLQSGADYFKAKEGKPSV
jgi:cell division protein FtsB